MSCRNAGTLQRGLAGCRAVQRYVQRRQGWEAPKEAGEEVSDTVWGRVRRDGLHGEESWPAERKRAEGGR